MQLFLACTYIPTISLLHDEFDLTPAAPPLLFIHSQFISIPPFSFHPPLPWLRNCPTSSPPKATATVTTQLPLMPSSPKPLTLEQIAALNSSLLSCSSSLPTNLETRFQKLKSFPVPATQPRMLESSTKSLNQCKSASAWPASDTETINEAEIIPSVNPNCKKSPDQKPREFLPSPPRRACCFGCLSSKKKPKDKQLKGRDWGKNDEILTDFSTFSFNEQQRKLKAALKEEEKVSREAARVVEWVKQASARMDVSAIDELVLSEDDKNYK